MYIIYDKLTKNAYGDINGNPFTTKEDAKKFRNNDERFIITNSNDHPKGLKKGIKIKNIFPSIPINSRSIKNKIYKKIYFKRIKHWMKKNLQCSQCGSKREVKYQLEKRYLCEKCFKGMEINEDN